jgi:hypothetical protein
MVKQKRRGLGRTGLNSAPGERPGGAHNSQPAYWLISTFTVLGFATSFFGTEIVRTPFL